MGNQVAIDWRTLEDEALQKDGHPDRWVPSPKGRRSPRVWISKEKTRGDRGEKGLQIQGATVSKLTTAVKCFPLGNKSLFNHVKLP